MALRAGPPMLRQLSAMADGAGAVARRGSGVDLWRLTQKSCSTMVSLNQNNGGDLRKRILVTSLLKKVYSVSMEMLQEREESVLQHSQQVQLHHAPQQILPRRSSVGEQDKCSDGQGDETVETNESTGTHTKKGRRRSSLTKALFGIFNRRSSDPGKHAVSDLLA